MPSESFFLYGLGIAVVAILGIAWWRARRRSGLLRLEAERARRGLEAETHERRQRDRELRREQELLERVFDSIPVIISIYDTREKVLRVNREFERRLGWSAADARERSLDDELFPDLAVRERVVDCRRRCSKDWTDVPVRTRFGENLQMSWCTTRLSDGNCLGLGIDITDRVRAEAELRLSESRFHHVADDAPVMIWVSDAHARCTWVNRPWLEFTGRTMEQELGDGWKEGVHPDDRLRAREVFEQALRERVPFTLEYRHRRRDDTYRWLENFGAPQSDADQAFSGYIGTCVDVTDRRVIEERLRNADRVKDEFLATLAHELRNPLAPIRNALAVIRNAPADSGEAMRARDIIDRQVHRMSRLVDDLLDVSRITRGIVPLRRERVTVAAVVADAIEASRPTIERKQHELRLHLPAESLVLEADPARLTQVLSNLLDNAAKYTGPGGTIEVAAWRDGDHAVLRVADSGIGIATDELSRIFEMFSRGGRSESGPGGLGIGLWLSRRLIELHGGSIEASSEGPGRGSQFLVRLPLAPEPSPPDPGPSGDWSDSQDRIRVLVVEDNADAAESMEMLLRQLGHEVWVAGDGRSGLSLAERERPEVVLLDIGLPELNGLEVARRIRRQPWGERMFLVALTGWGQEDDRRRSREAGFDHHLVKPVDPVTLANLLQSLHALARYR